MNALRLTSEICLLTGEKRFRRLPGGRGSRNGGNLLTSKRTAISSHARRHGSRRAALPAIKLPFLPNPSLNHEPKQI
jgi:hypothetical protein